MLYFVRQDRKRVKNHFYTLLLQTDKRSESLKVQTARMSSSLIHITFLQSQRKTTIQTQVIALDMETGVHQVIGRCKLVMLANSHDREVFQMVISIAVDVIEYNQLKETFHGYHPGWNISFYRTGNILEASIIFEISTLLGFILTNQRSEILHEIFASILGYVKPLSDIYHIAMRGKAKTVFCCNDAIYL